MGNEHSRLKPTQAASTDNFQQEETHTNIMWQQSQSTDDRTASGNTGAEPHIEETHPQKPPDEMLLCGHEGPTGQFDTTDRGVCDDCNFDETVKIIIREAQEALDIASQLSFSDRGQLPPALVRLKMLRAYQLQQQASTIATTLGAAQERLSRIADSIRPSSVAEGFNHGQPPRKRRRTRQDAGVDFSAPLWSSPEPEMGPHESSAEPDAQYEVTQNKRTMLTRSMPHLGAQGTPPELPAPRPRKHFTQRQAQAEVTAASPNNAATTTNLGGASLQDSAAASHRKRTLPASSSRLKRFNEVAPTNTTKPLVYSYDQLLQTLSVWQPNGQAPAPASDLPPTLKTALHPYLERLRSHGGWNKLQVNSKETICATRREYRTTAVLDDDLEESCKYCIKYGKVCIRHLGQQRLLVPRPESHRQDRRPDEIEFWVSPAEPELVLSA